MSSTMNIDSELQNLADQMATVRVAQWFEGDSTRATDLRCTANGIVLDYSKHRIDPISRERLLELAKQSNLANDFDALTQGEAVNITEERAALHTLLRGTRADTNPELHAEIQKTNTRLAQLVSEIHREDRTGFGGTRFTDVVHIGIGGSDFGPKMVCRALRSDTDTLNAHFIANVDPQDLDETLATLDPRSTFFIVCSKSFTTEETLTNALRARAWLLAAGAGESDIDKHMVAVTTNLEAASGFGISQANCFPIWDWVGGRYSLWSAVGISIALQSGWATFQRLLNGAQEMDLHTLGSRGADNFPLMMALLEYWNTLYLRTDTHVVLPYAQRLEQLPDFLQQLSMESNGKRVDLAGAALAVPSAPVLWGSAGTIGQHSYYQLLHQGNRRFTADIILPLTQEGRDFDAQRKLVANALAQSRALLIGRNPSEALQLAQERGQPDSFAAHYEMPGNHSHSLIYFEALTPEILGALIAAYEHKTFFLSRLLGINAFDQWGVELGKVIGRQISTMLEHGEGLDTIDPATAMAIQAWRSINVKDTNPR